MTEKYMGNTGVTGTLLISGEFQPPAIWNNDRSRGTVPWRIHRTDRIENQEANLQAWPVWGWWILVKLGPAKTGLRLEG